MRDSPDGAPDAMPDKHSQASQDSFGKSCLAA